MRFSFSHSFGTLHPEKLLDRFRHELKNEKQDGKCDRQCEQLIKAWNFRADCHNVTPSRLRPGGKQKATWQSLPPGR